MGFLQDFMKLESAARRAAKRQQAVAISISDSVAESRLRYLQEEIGKNALVEASSVADQLVIAADLKPRKFRTKWQQAVCEGPAARKDAESTERGRWVAVLADLLRSTITPMGRLQRENPSTVQLLGKFRTK